MRARLGRHLESTDAQQSFEQGPRHLRRSYRALRFSRRALRFSGERAFALVDQSHEAADLILGARHLESVLEDPQATLDDRELDPEHLRRIGPVLRHDGRVAVVAGQQAPR
jgi:hypothetical protein